MNNIEIVNAVKIEADYRSAEGDEDYLDACLDILDSIIKKAMDEGDTEVENYCRELIDSY